MPIPSSGEIKISEIATEFGDTAPNQMSEYYRGGGLVPNTPANAAVPTSGQIAVADFYGAQNRASVPLTISANTQNYNVYTQANASPLYVAGSTDVTLTINPGVAVGSSTTGAYALSVPNSFNPADTVTIVNNGTIIGRGGNGGNGGSKYSPSSPTGVGPGFPGSNAGSAVYVNFPTVITNNGTIAGGGGGGGGGAATQSPGGNFGGGGGGGGAGYSGGSGGGLTPPTSTIPFTYNGSPGAAGTLTAGGAGGSIGGGTGGGQGANGSNGSPGVGGAGGTGGTRGYYLVGNPLVTFPATGTLLGQVS